MDTHALLTALADNHNPHAIGAFVAVVDIRCAGDQQAVRLVFEGGKLDTLLVTTDSDDGHMTLYFHDARSAFEVLRGERDAIRSFMNGEFRSDGYLLWIFNLLAIFRAA